MPPTPKNRGMTLLEVMVATFLLSVGGLALLQGLYFSKKTTDDGQKKLALFNLVRGYLDQLRSLDNSSLEKNLFTLYHTDGSSMTFTENAWSEIPTQVMAFVAPGVRLQIKPTVTLEDTSNGDWYLIHLDYRYAWGRSASSSPTQWPLYTLQALVSKLDNNYTIALTPTTEIFLESNQQPKEWPTVYGSIHPKYYEDTLPRPPYPPPVPWIPSIPPNAWTPAPPYVPPPAPPQNNSSAL